MKIVTAAYDLTRSCNQGAYKGFDAAYIQLLNLLPKGDWIKYVIYTDSVTYGRYQPSFDTLRDKENVMVKFFNWQDSEYHPKLQTIIEQARDKVPCDIRRDKHILVNGYCEVVTSKFKFVMENIEDDDIIFWLDAGLFHGSCNIPWRDWIRENCNTKFFFNKVGDMAKDDFLIAQSNVMPHPVEVRDIINTIVPEQKGSNLIVSGGFWGGNFAKVKDLCEEMREYGHKILDMGIYVSDQECMACSLVKDNTRFKVIEFGNWYDYQSVFLRIMGLYNSDTYSPEICDLSNV